MSKLVDIKGFVSSSDGDDFNRNLWVGKLLLEDDGWFEGIITEPYCSYTDDIMIFGIYHPSRIIELIETYQEYICDPLVYRCQRNDKGYDGDISIIGFLGERHVEDSRITTQHVEYLKEKNDPEFVNRDIEKEKEELLNRINAFKQNGDYAELYENTKGMRSNLSEYVLRKYKGEVFTKSQIESFLEPVRDKVEEDTNNAIKKMIKNKQ